jgi:hypothetical protein
VALFAARRDGQTVGTIAPFVDRHFVEHVGERQGGFGFFEVVEDYAVARELLDTARQWLRDRGIVSVRGPTSFSDNDSPGVLVEATDCPPVILEAHTPPKIREAAVVGVPAAMTGESVWAFVILEDGVRMTAQQVLSYCRQEMEPHVIPSEVRFVTHFPCSQSGKVRKVELRARALQQMEGREPT